MRFRFIALFIALYPTARAVEIPKNLTAADRAEVVRTLGLSTSSKLLTSPYPLGGYAGVEIGLSLEVVDTADLSRLGDHTKFEPEFRYPRISIGKGLYHDMDVFLHFIPYTQASNIAEFGGLVKWSFYQAKFLPINVSAVVHGSSMNVGDSFISQTTGVDAVIGVMVNDFSLYFGGGQLETKAEFMSGTGDRAVVDPSDPGVNSENVALETIREVHSFLGASFHFGDMFAAAQIDRYKNPVYSMKLGFRY